MGIYHLSFIICHSREARYELGEFNFALVFRKFIIGLWVLLAVVILAVWLFFVAIWKGWIGYVPDVDALENPIERYASQVLSSDGALLGTYSFSENRLFVERDAISPMMFQALIATEDKRFYHHSGIDLRAVLRAVVKRGLLRQSSAGGGSTITQQLAKQLYTERAETSGRRVMQKLIEWVIAIRIERMYSKDEILTLYLNYFDFLHGAVGVESAAKVYFNKTARELTTAECAMLVAMCKNPSLYNPVRNPERVKERRDLVLSLMADAGYLSDDEARATAATPLGLDFHRMSHKEGSATYLREHLRRILMASRPQRGDYGAWGAESYRLDSLAWETDPLYGWCKKNKKPNGDTYNIYTDGLRIVTTVDSRMQGYAEEALRNHLSQTLQPQFNKQKNGNSRYPFSSNLSDEEFKKIMNQAMAQTDRYRGMKKAGKSQEEIERVFRTPTEMTVFSYAGSVDTVMTPWDSIRYMKSFLRAGFMAMDPSTGEVKAIVGGVDQEYFSYDMALTGTRQVGSTIKPFLYALAMETGFTPCDLAPNVQRTYMVAGKPWTPRNGSKARYGEQVTLRWGLSQSNNWISAYLMSRLDPDNFVTLLKNFGIEGPGVYPSMSLCLGPCDVNLSKMVSGYTAFVNGGIRVAPLMVTRIENDKGEVLATFSAQLNEAISEQSSWEMLDMLQAVVDYGTGRRLRFRYNFTGQIAAKTGTTQNNSDAWFMGAVPRLVGGAWVGGENRDIHFNSMAQGQGAAAALPIWAEFMKRVYGNGQLGYRQDEKFNIPEDFEPCKAQEEEDDEIDELFQ